MARSTFRSQNVQSAPGSDHFWKLRCRKSARRCGAKHISKSTCAKHFSFGPLLEVEMSKKCTPLWREAHFEVNMCKTLQLRSIFRSCDVEKVHAVVARSTFRSQNVQSTPGSDHFWNLRCRKSARRCGAKHISKSTCAKHFSFGPLLEVEMSKKCTPLWREAHFEVNMCKTLQLRSIFRSCDVEKVHAVVARSTFRSQNVKSTTCSHRFWTFRCRFAWQAQGTVDLVKKCAKREGFVTFSTTTTTTPHYTPIHYTTTITTTAPSLHSTTLHPTTLHYTTLHSITLNYTQLHYTTLHYTTLHYTTLHYTTLHYTTFHYTSLHYTTLHSTTVQLQLQNYTPLHSTTLHYTKLHSATLHYTTLHSTTLCYITLQYTTLHYTE